MRFDFKYGFFLWIIFACNSPNTATNNESLNEVKFKYIKTIHLLENQDQLVIEYPSIHKKTKISKNELPIQECLVMNTGSIAFISAINELGDIMGVGSKNYIYNNDILQKIEKGEIQDLGNDHYWDIEKIIASRVKFIFCNYNSSFENTYKQLENLGTHIIFIDEYLESNPLGRTEFLKLFGYLFNKRDQAHQLFLEVENNYNRILQTHKEVKNKPKILAKIMYGDIWYMPEGESYSAQLYEDAGADYPWSASPGNASLNLTYEEVFQKAYDAEVWLDASDVESAAQLLAQSDVYSTFDAFKMGQLYSLSGRKKGQANDFYERGVIRADSVLWELNYILRNYQNIQSDSLFYYRKLK